MNILITGGCGHIGSYVIRNLVGDYNITVVDNLITGRYCSLFDMDRPIKFIEDDIDNISEEMLSNFDVVLHLAAITDAAGSFGNKEEIEVVNVEKTKSLIDRCMNSNIKTFVFPSSTSVYGVSVDVVDESNDGFINPQSPYAESKVVIENYLKDVGINHYVFRFGTIFGLSVGMRFHTAINKFCYQKSIGEPLTIWKENYHQVRPYLGLGDCLSVIEMAFRGEIPYGLYNVLSENIKLSEVVKVIGDVDINFIDTPLLNQFSYDVSFKKIGEFGFVPKDSISDEIPLILNKLRNLNG